MSRSETPRPTTLRDSKDRVDEWRECRSLRKDEDGSDECQDEDDRKKPELFSDAHEVPELTSKTAGHTRFSGRVNARLELAGQRTARVLTTVEPEAVRA